ncbi:mycofactocin-coupled SDR family oxidoreductase [Rhodococcus sp. 14C212]|uniref:mycofactocin-coupled SDR family oxidoreductase n=1 Tax=Rhodococcus sp. 14C212 TaxID=2711209 RepID=UPI0013EC970D|nr:mycofactocin-coupled SDR family oxidoreductase [Rhodococcus sp. 14C212]
MVALISGVARGQGRSHAVRMAKEGADIIGFDICANIESVPYPLATPADLDETARLIEMHGRRASLHQADVRDLDAVTRLIQGGVDEFGRLDIVLANAGIMPIVGAESRTIPAFHDAVEVMLSGVFNTVYAAIPHLQASGRGGAVVITSSSAGLRGMGDETPGSLGYVAAKHGVVGLMRAWANVYAKHNIRFNTVHPTGVNTPMIDNDAFRDHIQAHPEIIDNIQNPLWIPEAGTLEADDVTDLVLHLASDAAKYSTGGTFTVDAGFTNKV